MKPYPLGIDNPIAVKAVWGSTKWALYWKEDWIKIGTFPNEFVAMGARRAILTGMGYN
jgi:hypothetical protein